MRKQKNDKEPVNFIHQFLLSMEKISETPEMNPTHVSLYISLFALWNLNQFRNPISINRREVMSISRIGSKHTYHKCLRDLHKMNFLEYFPSHNPMKGSLIEMFIFSTSLEQAVNDSGVKNGTSAEQVLHPSLNSKNLLNKKEYIIKEDGKSEKNALKKTGEKKTFKPPTIDEITTFFTTSAEKYNIPSRIVPIESEKFYNYYSSKGWKVGSNSPMKDWKAAVNNWLLNFNKFNQIKVAKNEAGKLHSKEEKSYDIPL
jgi:hypothetical protein